MIWLRRFIWTVAVGGWALFIVYCLLDAHPAGEVIAWCVLAIGTWIAIGVILKRAFGLRRKVQQHLGWHPRYAVSLVHPTSERLADDLIRAMWLTAQKEDRKVYGFDTYWGEFQEGLIGNPEATPLRWQSKQTDINEWEELPANGLFFLQTDNSSFVAAVFAQHSTWHHGEDDVLEDDHPHTPQKSGPRRLHLLARNAEDLKSAREWLLKKAQEKSAFRGRQLIVRSGERRAQPISIEFTEVKPVPRQKIVLPDRIFDVIQRAALNQLEGNEALERAGHRTRTALLLFGPPGTGKTLLTRYIATSQKNITTILLHGFRRGLVREVFRLARYCQPSIIIIEDVDLIATRRQRTSRTTAPIHELLDELDGLAVQSRSIVIMTTNRPDVLEPALAMRPGRVSQAIEVGLPDAEGRRQLLELFTTQVNLMDVNLDHWVERTGGASPAFLEELVRRAILFASAQHPDSSSPLPVRDEDFAAAIDEIISVGGSLTNRLLGYASE